MKLQVKFVDTLSQEIINLYKNNKNYKKDAGFNLYNYELIEFKPWESKKVKLGIMCQNITNDSGYYLYPRSSIAKTTFRLSNSVGIIDNEYRGEIIATVDNFSNLNQKIEIGTSLFQLCSPDLIKMEVIFINTLSETERGENGFGSTNSKNLIFTSMNSSEDNKIYTVEDYMQHVKRSELIKK